MGTTCSSSSSRETTKVTSQSHSRPNSISPLSVHPPSPTKPSLDQTDIIPTEDQSNAAKPAQQQLATTGVSTNGTSLPQRPTSAMPEPPRPKFATPEVVKLPCLETLSTSVGRRACGRLLEEREKKGNALPALEDKVIRVYHIALLKDSHEERDVLLERIYPQLQLYCLERGFDLDIIDLHWGQRDPYVSLGYVGTTPCQFLTSLLQKDQNVLIVVFLNEKYGKYGCPSTISEEHMAPILESLPDNDRDFIERWYCLDTNAIPASYILQPIVTHIAQYGSTNEDDHKKACSEWSDVEDKIGDILWKYSDYEFQTVYLRSELEQELETSVFTDWCPADNVIVVKRTVTNGDVTGVVPQQLADYIDLKMGKPDKTAQTRLNNLTNRLNDKVEPSNRIHCQVSRDGRGHQDRYLEDLCARYHTTLSAALEKVMEVKGLYDRVRVNVLGSGMQKYLYDDILHHTLMCQHLSTDVIGREDVLSLLTNYVIDGHPTASSQHVRPLVVYGATGSGKSTMAASLAVKSCQMTGWTKSVCIIRHIGCSSGCQSLDEVIASVSGHICFLHGLPYSYAHKPVSMFPTSFTHLLNRVPTGSPLVLVLDGLDLLNHLDTLEWLPEELPSHVRVILTVNEGSTTLVSLKKLSGFKEGYFVEVPALVPTDALALMDTQLTSYGRRLTDGQRKVLEDAISVYPNPLYIKTAAIIAKQWRSYTDQSDIQLGRKTEDLLKKDLLKCLERCHGDESIGRLLSYLSALQEGVSDMEMKDMLSSDEGFLIPVYMHWEPMVRRAPSYIWLDVVSFLQPCLLSLTTSGGLALTKWRHNIMGDVFRDVCRCYESATWIKILDYFEGRWASGKQLPYPFDEEGIEHTRNRLAKPQPILYKDSYNHRKMEQISICLINNDMFKTLRDDFLLNIESLTHMISALNLYRVLYCMDLYVKAEEDPDVSFMYDLLRQHANVVCQGSDNLWSQFYLQIEAGKLNVSGFPAIQKLFESLSSAPSKGNPKVCSPFLIPSTSSALLNAQQHARAKSPAILHGLFTVPGDPNHVISVSTDEGEVTVWNIHHQQAVRTISNLPQPKSLKMITSVRSVVLCNRELRVYNFEEGKEESRLKGVLNLKMPYFGVLDSEHTVALSRNRMYVNIMNNSTGDTEATFKVGEDRFLDSLIISANGEWCVCGDQVQKPFPLLVWDLVNRKLVHDMRIAGHEFLTRMAAITAEGHYVVCVCRLVETEANESQPEAWLTQFRFIHTSTILFQYASAPLKRYSIIERSWGYTEDSKDEALIEPNFLIVYDLQSGSLFKKWKPAYSTTSVQISSASNLVVSGHEDGTVIVWDLVGGALKHELSGHWRGPDHISMSEDGGRAATCDLTCRDTSVHLWDLDKGECLGSFVLEYGVTCCELSLDGSVVVIGVPGSGKIVSLWANKDDRDKSKMDISMYGDASRNKQTFTMED